VFGYAFLFGYAFVIGYVSACQVVLPVKLFICVSRGKSETMILNKTFLTAVALAAPLVISVGVLAPAQAAPISAGSILNLSSLTSVPGVPNSGGDVVATGSAANPTGLNFRSPAIPFVAGSAQRIGIGTSTGTFTDAYSTLVLSSATQIKDLTFSSGTNFTGTFANFITGIRVGPLLSPNIFSFDLTRFIYTASTGDATIEGIFRSGSDSIAATGLFTSQLGATSSDPSSYSLSLTAAAVPTPAALPALIGFGVGLVRKRKAAQLAEAAV
jgi:hypothetical protein